MKLIKTKPNVFVVDTPHQLLNAIEAVHWFQLTNNHLLVTMAKNANNDRFMSLIKAGDWVTVSFPSPIIDPARWVQKLLGSVANRWYCRYLHFRRMYTVAKLTARFKNVDKLFVGHDWAEEKPYMRHISNAIKYDALYLLDDGIDTIDINERRNRSKCNKQGAQTEKSNTHASVYKKIERYLRTKYWNWNVAEASNVTFFTVYDLDVRNGDSLIRNNYSHLRSLAPLQRIHLPDTVIFIGQCMVDDGCFEMNTYLDFLSKVREYFAEKRLIYVPHPRESASCVTRVMEHLQCELWRPSSVIEYDLIVRGIQPKVVAGFVSSALVTLAYLMDSDVEIVCFRIAPVYWMKQREDAVGAYDYLKTKAHRRVTIVPLTGQENEFRSHLELT